MSTTPETPLVEAHGREAAPSSPARVVALWGCAGMMAFCVTNTAVVALAYALNAGAPAIPVEWFVPADLLPVGIAVVGSLWSLREFRRAGTVQFFADRIELTRGGRRQTFLWDSCGSFRDGSSDVIELVHHDRFQPSVFVPTLDERTRTAVLTLLIERGVPRHES